MVGERAPETLLEAVQYFANKDVALAFFVSLRWPNGVTCPRCESQSATFLSTRRLWKCKGCTKQFSAKVGTIFEDSPIALEKWLPAMWMLANCKNGISSYELARAIGVTQKTAWFMLSRIRLALQDGQTGGKLGGDVEADETYIGGKARNMHASKRKRLNVKRGRSTNGKVAVMALLDRHGKDGVSQVRTEVLTSLKKRTVQAHVRDHVEAGANLHTDAFFSYSGLNGEYVLCVSRAVPPIPLPGRAGVSLQSPQGD